jgi:hypothetical protein
MTFNLRFENEIDGDNRWANRCELLVKTILNSGPHIIGTQEGKPSQLDFLSARLVGYRISAESRHWERECQYPTLFYREGASSGCRRRLPSTGARTGTPPFPG